MIVSEKITNTFFDTVIEEIEDYAIILLDLDGNITGWNKGAEKVKGYIAEEILGRNFEIFYTDSDRKKKLPQALLKIAQEDGKAKHEGWRVKKDSSVFWGKILITAIHDNFKNVTGFIKVTRDISFELSQFEETKNVEERLGKMINELQDVSITMLGVDGEVLNWSTGSQKIHGYKPDEIIGKNFSVFYKEEDKALNKPQETLNLAKENGKIILEGWRLKKDGTPFWAKVFITPIYDKRKEHIGFYRLLYDLTDKKNYEDTLLRQKNEVDLKNKEVEQFAYIASHDLQQPLRTIIALAGVLDQKNKTHFDENDKKSMQYLFESAERMSQLINDLLDYSRLGINAEFTKFDLGKIVQNVLDDLQSLIKTKQANVTVDTMPVITGNETHIRLLFQNLITNALKFTRADILPEIKITSSESGLYWQFAIQDNGIGIAEKDYEKIFMIFQRLNSAQKFEGSGIGLAHCDKIVKQHLGKIWVTSQVNKGSTFYVTILKNLSNEKN